MLTRHQVASPLRRFSLARVRGHRPRRAHLVLGAVLVLVGSIVAPLGSETPLAREIGFSPSPAAAQYAGHDRGLIITPVRLPVGSNLSGVGFGCSPRSTVSITIEGQPGILTTVTAGDDGTYSFTAATPPPLQVGETYTLVASCNGEFETANFTVICANGDEPTETGGCADDSDSGITPTPTTLPGSSNPGGSLAVTGSNTNALARLAATLVGLGAILFGLGRRAERRDRRMESGGTAFGRTAPPSLREPARGSLREIVPPTARARP